MKLNISIIAAGVFFIFGGNAWADSGTIESVTSLTGDFITMEHLDGTVTIGNQKGTSTVIKSSGGPFVEGHSTNYHCLAYIRKTSAGFGLESSCTATYASGEMTFMRASRKIGDIEAGGGGEGVTMFVGGTGQFEGITGRCTYKIDYLADNEMVSKAKCNWQRP